MPAPPENARRLPNLPLTRLVPLAATIEEATKAVVGQLIRLAPPSSATMLGKSVAVISRFIECTSTLARVLGITVVGIRQHLAKLHAEGLVAFDDRTGAIGRPKRFWRLTANGHGRFPDTHGDLTVNLIGGIRSVFGEAGLDRLIEARQEAAVTA